MKNIICFGMDLFAISLAFIFTDLVAQSLQSQNSIIEFLVFLGFSVVFEGTNIILLKFLRLR